MNNVGRGKKSIAALATTGETSETMMITENADVRKKYLWSETIAQTFLVSISDISSWYFY